MKNMTQGQALQLLQHVEAAALWEMGVAGVQQQLQDLAGQAAQFVPAILGEGGPEFAIAQGTRTLPGGLTLKLTVTVELAQ